MGIKAGCNGAERKMPPEGRETMDQDAGQRKVNDVVMQGEACYRDLFEGSRDAVYVSTRQGRILSINKAGIELFGYSREEMIGMDIRALYTDPHDRQRFQQEIEPTGAVKDYEVRLKRKDGRKLHCLLTSTVRRSAGGDVLGYQGIIRDITAHKKAEQALRSSEEKFSKIFHSSPDWMAISALSDGRLIDVNNAFCKITGYTRAEVIGKTSFALGLWVEREERARMAEVLHREGRIIDHETRFRMKSGEIRTMLRSAELIELDGETCVINVTRDITQRKRDEEQIKTLNRELRQRVTELQEANRQLDAFSFSVSHDLRSPLSVIGGFARRLLQSHGGVIDEAAREKLETIRANVKKMEELIDALLTFSRSGRQQMSASVLDMEELVDSTFKELKAAAPARAIDLKKGTLLPVYGDKSLIRQVLVNLLANAFKFTRLREAAVIEVESRHEDGEIVYCVRDNGVGFDSQYAGRLFDVFQRAHSYAEFEGTGIGLSIVHRVITRHGGRLWAEGKKGEGAVFCFTLPRVPSGEG
jgi:PAS domain S-box-containing protein